MKPQKIIEPFGESGDTLPPRRNWRARVRSIYRWFYMRFTDADLSDEEKSWMRVGP
jgi:hypothetical protein